MCVCACAPIQCMHMARGVGKTIHNCIWHLRWRRSYWTREELSWNLNFTQWPLAFSDPLLTILTRLFLGVHGRLGVNYFSCMKKTLSVGRILKLLACKHGSSTPQPIPSCRRPSFSRLSDHKDSSLDRQSSALPHDHQLGLGSVLQFLSSAVFNSSQSLAPCLHVLCVFSKFVSFPAHQTPRL